MKTEARWVSYQDTAEISNSLLCLNDTSTIANGASPDVTQSLGRVRASAMSSEPANKRQVMTVFQVAGIKWRQSEPPEPLQTGRRLSTINRDTVLKSVRIDTESPFFAFCELAFVFDQSEQMRAFLLIYGEVRNIGCRGFCLSKVEIN